MNSKWVAILVERIAVELERRAEQKKSPRNTSEAAVNRQDVQASIPVTSSPKASHLPPSILERFLNFKSITIKVRTRRPQFDPVIAPSVPSSVAQ